MEGEYITLDGNSPVLSHIVIGEAEPVQYQATIVTSGTVQAIPSRYAEITSPFAGRIMKSFVRLGQKISAGSPIFEINSPAFFEAGKIYYQAKKEMELAQKQLSRERDLLANHVGVVKALEEAEVDYELKKEEYEHAVATLKVFQIDAADFTLGKPLVVRSPIDGEVMQDKIVIGQYIREDADALAIVANIDKVWVSAYAKEKDISAMDRIDRLEISLTAYPNRTFSGKIYHVGDLLDPETRSAEVIIECDNPGRIIKPYMYGAVTFTASKIDAVRIPHSAVLQDEDGRYALVSEGNNRFRKAMLTIAPQDKTDSVVVLSGIRSSDEIVIKGAFYFIDAR
jgi:cobalt-zinc-cadmium efflux system membrane fusion protein